MHTFWETYTITLSHEVVILTEKGTKYKLTLRFFGSIKDLVKMIQIKYKMIHKIKQSGKAIFIFVQLNQ